MGTGSAIPFLPFLTDKNILLLRTGGRKKWTEGLETHRKGKARLKEVCEIISNLRLGLGTKFWGAGTGVEEEAAEGSEG